MTQTTEDAANELAAAYLAAEKALTKLQAEIRQFQKAKAAEGSAIGAVTFAAIEGFVAGAAGAVAQSHLMVTPFDPRPHPMDGGGGK